MLHAALNELNDAEIFEKSSKHVSESKTKPIRNNAVYCQTVLERQMYLLPQGGNEEAL